MRDQTKRKEYQRAYVLKNKERLAVQRRAYMAVYRVKNRDKVNASVKQWHSRRKGYKYGLNTESLKTMYAEQDGKCAICLRKIKFLKFSDEEDLIMHIDHDHKTDKVRALLCSRCNKGLGQFMDKPSNLRAAAEYLERHSCGKILG